MINLDHDIILPENFEFNGEFFRWGKKFEFWAVGKDWEYKGNQYQIISYGNFKEDLHLTWRSYESKDQTPYFKKKENEALTQMATKAKYEKELKHENCERKWLPVWMSLPKESPTHEYLIKKGIESNFSARSKDETLYIEARDENGFRGVQMIFPGDAGYEKRFSTGIKKQGSFSSIPSISEVIQAETIYIAEGFATAASVYMATKIPTAVSFDSGNIFSAIQTIRHLNPKCKIIICADDDKNKIGIKKALQAKSQYSNTAIRMPKFRFKDDSKTDFNDLHQAEGLETLTDQLAFTDDEFLLITPMGYNEGNYFYTSSKNSQIIRIASSNHKETTLYQLAPREYWEKRYEKPDKEGNIKFSWGDITSKLMDDCHSRGLFNPEKVRGKGVWSDGGVFVINDGQKVINIPESSNHHYQKLMPTTFKTENPFNDKEMEDLLLGFRALSYKNKEDYLYLSAWVVQAQIFACLPWRFHLWITGEAGTGKSTVLNWLASMTPLCEQTNNATAAGIRQTIKNDATAVIVDESEPDSGRVKQIIELARQMSTNDSNKTMRGSSGGSAVNFNTQTNFVFGSIQTDQLNAADRSRIFTVELNDTKDQSFETFAVIDDIFKQSISGKDRLFARTYQCLPSILKSIGNVKKYLHEAKKSARVSDQMATLIACFWVYKSTNPIEKDEIEALLEVFKIDDSEYIEANREKESETCLNAILAIKTDSYTINIASCIQEVRRSLDDQKTAGSSEKMLASFGIRWIESKKALFIASKSQPLINALKSHPDYSKVLRRDLAICINPNETQQVLGFNPKPKKGLLIKID